MHKVWTYESLLCSIQKIVTEALECIWSSYSHSFTSLLDSMLPYSGILRLCSELIISRNLTIALLISRVLIHHLQHLQIAPNQESPSTCKNTQHSAEVP